MSTGGDVDGERLSALLTPWAADRLQGSGDVRVRRLPQGHSNLTFIVTREDSDREWILRRPPHGPLLPSAHDVLREARMITALKESPARLPVVVGWDEGEVLGVPFYVMERLRGEVVREDMPAWLGNEPSRRALGLDVVDALAELHQADTAPVIDAGLGRPGGYLLRQLRRWTGQREGVRTYASSQGLVARELPDYELVRDWLRGRLEDLDGTSRIGVVHGDYKLDNVLVDPVTLSVRAILDWEMSTIGDPLADLGHLLSMSPRPDSPSPMPQLTGEVTAQSGFLTRDEIVDRYAEKSGHHPRFIVVYEVLSLWKMATLLEMSYYRHLAGTTDDPLFPELEWGVPALFARAADLAAQPVTS